MRRRDNRKICDICSKRYAKILMRQYWKGDLDLEVCYVCQERWERYHYDTITVTDEDVIGIDDGKPVFRDGLFPDKKVLIRYKLKHLEEIV